MRVPMVNRGQKLQLTEDSRGAIIQVIEDGASVVSNCASFVSITKKVGNNVRIELGDNSLLAIGKGVTIGSNFQVKIDGKQAAITSDSKIPDDAKLKPRPRL